jgi:cellulose synthase/poly-beta-1,6-N-acetylglucosamine synthase-like glycosyltransferase
MLAALAGAAALLFLLLALHPFLLYPLSLRVFARRAPRENALAEADRPSVAICVCAYNEEACIERKMANLLELRDRLGALEILVYVDASTDGTAALLAPYAEVATIVVARERRGKTYGMNLLVERCSADIVVFTDANVHVDPPALDALLREFRDPQIGCVCGHLIYTNGETTATAQIGSLYWRLEEQIKRQESALGAVMGADGSLFAIRRALHHPVPEMLIDDMFVSLSILCDGYGVVRAPDALAYEASATASADEFRRKIRIACQAFNVHRVLWPRLRLLPAQTIYMYLSHKLLRWLAAFNLAIASGLAAIALMAFGVPASVLIVAASAGMLLLRLAMRYRLRPWVSIGEILIALVGAAAGVLQSMRGQTFQTWTPAASVRRGD